LRGDSTTEAQEATMYHHHITRAIAQAQVADMQRTAAHNRATALVRPRHRRRAIIAALTAICALAPAAAARAQPAHDIGTSTNGAGGAIGQPADSVTATRQSYAEQVSKLSFEELAAAFGSDVPTAKVGDTPGAITFTNPLGRSRGPGAGAGLL
jgi:hypothetical protein